MPTRTSFQKRQKELMRLEKQRDKAAKRLARKAASKAGTGTLEPIEEEPLQQEQSDERPVQ
jgi:hypothetical protein